MIENSVVMRFKDEIGKTVSMSIRDAKDDVSDAAVSAVMDSVINTGIIVGAGGAYVEKIDAEKIVKETTKVSL